MGRVVTVRRGGFAFTLVLLGLVAVLLVQTMRLGPVARRVPGTVVVITFALLLFQTARGAGAASRDARAAAALREPRAAAAAAAAAAPGTSEARRDLIAAAWILVIPGLLFAVGFLPAIVLYTSGYLRFRAGMRWLPSVVAAFALAALIHAVVDRLLGIPLYRGYLLR